MGTGPRGQHTSSRERRGVPVCGVQGTHMLCTCTRSCAAPGAPPCTLHVALLPKAPRFAHTMHTQHCVHTLSV